MSLAFSLISPFFMYCFKGLFMGQHQENLSYIKIITERIISLTFRSVTTEQSMLRTRQFNFQPSLMHLAGGVGYFALRKSGPSQKHEKTSH